jgi:hypothetical protein
MLEDFKLLVETGVLKSISKKVSIKVEWILIKQNKINWALMFLNKLITLIMLHYRDLRLTWITSMPNQIQEDKSWNKNKRPLREPTIQTQLKLLIQPKIHLKLRLTSTSTASTMLVWTLTNMLLKLHQLLLAITLRNNLPTSQLELLINKRS